MRRARMPDLALTSLVLAAGQWPDYGRDYTNRRWSTLAQINAGNVSGLRLAWVHHSHISHASETNPIVVTGVMYFSTSLNNGAAESCQAASAAARTMSNLQQRSPRRGACGARTVSLLLASAALAACSRPNRNEIMHGGGDAGRGKVAIATYGCGACHSIPGIAGAHGQVGPPLDHWSRRVYIAGEVPNTEDFLIRWIEVPEAIEPRTAMPMLGVTEGSARDIAAYLYSIR